MTPLTLVHPRGRHPWHVFFFSVRSGWLASDVATLTLPEGCSWESCHFNAGDVAPWFPLVFFSFGKGCVHKKRKNKRRRQALEISSSLSWNLSSGEASIKNTKNNSRPPKFNSSPLKNVGSLLLGR